MNTPMAIDPENEYAQRFKRDLYDDLIGAVELLRVFDMELNKLHPKVSDLIRVLINR